MPVGGRPLPGEKRQHGHDKHKKQRKSLRGRGAGGGYLRAEREGGTGKYH